MTKKCISVATTQSGPVIETARVYSAFAFTDQFRERHGKPSGLEKVDVATEQMLRG